MVNYSALWAPAAGAVCTSLGCSSVLGRTSYSNLVSIRPASLMFLDTRQSRVSFQPMPPQALSTNWQLKAQQRSEQHLGMATAAAATLVLLHQANQTTSADTKVSYEAAPRSRSRSQLKPKSPRALRTSGGTSAAQPAAESVVHGGNQRKPGAGAAAQARPAASSEKGLEQDRKGRPGAIVPLYGSLQDLAADPASAALPRVRQGSGARDGKWAWTRRSLLQAASAGGLLTLAAASAQASRFEVVDRAWEVVGGAPADLYFPDEFLGTWTIKSTLVSLELPLGRRFVPNMQVVQRAEREDLNREITYQAAFIRNRQGRVVIDRRFNTSKLLQVYLGPTAAKAEDISWDENDPNVLALLLPGGINVITRVTKRSLAQPEPSRIDTSEYFQQVFDAPGRQDPRVKASQCFTKYKWRDEAAAERDGGPAIVATQVISDYLTSFDNERLALEARDRPVVVFTYRMAFHRTNTKGVKV